MIRLAHALAVVALGGIAVAIGATVVGHLGLGPAFDPVDLTVSDFALSDHGTAIVVAMVALGLASAALLGALFAARAPVRGAPGLLILLWTVGLFVAAAVPTDPVSAPVMTLSGYIHRYASVAAFVSLPAAALLLVRRLSADRFTGLLRGLALASATGLLAMLYVTFPGDRVLIGLVERLLLAAEVALVTVVAFRLARQPASGNGLTAWISSQPANASAA